MTRVNSSLNPKFLTNEHLLAEHREIKRLPSAYLKAIQSGSILKIPDRFLLGKGHILFHLDKGNYTYNRYLSIHKECLVRRFNVIDYSDNWKVYKPEHWGSYVENERDRDLIISRIIENIKSSTLKEYHYFSEKISASDAIDLLKLTITNP